MDILYADDICLMADNVSSLQTFINSLNESCRKFGLVISVSKTQVLKQPARGETADPTTLTLSGNPLEEVTSFRYLGSNIRDDNRLVTEISSRIAKAAASFGKLSKRVWDSHDLHLHTKVAVYKAIIIPILLYATETWCLYKGDIRRLNTFHMKCLRSILRIRWQDHVPNSEVLRRTQLSGIEALLIKGQLRWCGHVVRMADSRLPKLALFSQLAQGKRKPGGQFLRYKDVLKRHLTSCNIPCDNWEELAHSRPEWRKIVHKACARYEANHLEHHDAKHQLQKSRPKTIYTYSYNSSGQLYCAACNRTFKTKFGLASHIRSHQRNKT